MGRRKVLFQEKYADLMNFSPLRAVTNTTANDDARCRRLKENEKPASSSSSSSSVDKLKYEATINLLQTQSDAMEAMQTKMEELERKCEEETNRSVLLSEEIERVKSASNAAKKTLEEERSREKTWREAKNQKRARCEKSWKR